MSSGVGQTFPRQIDNRNVLSGQVLGRCAYNLSWQMSLIFATMQSGRHASWEGERAGGPFSTSRTWRGTFVEEGNLEFQVGALRRALGDGRGGRRYIATSAGQGYRFVAPVSVAQAP